MYSIKHIWLAFALLTVMVAPFATTGQIITVKQPMYMVNYGSQLYPNTDTLYYVKDKILGDSLKLEFQLDNSMDFHGIVRLYLNGTQRQRAYLTFLKDTSIDGQVNSLLFLFYQNDTIGNNYNWSQRPGSYDSGYLSRYWKRPSFGDVSTPHLMNKGWVYLGFKMALFNGSKHYGWMRLKFDYDLRGTWSKLEVSDYAYESTPDKFILAGQTQEDIDKADPVYIKNNSFQETFKVYPNPSSSGLNISNLSKSEGFNIRILTIEGKVVEEFRINFGEEIRLNHLQKGTYFIGATNNRENLHSTFVVN